MRSDRGLTVLLGVQGRFHAFDLARGLTSIGVATTVATNYPRPVCARFGLDSASVESNALHGIATRVAAVAGLAERSERPLHEAFGRWLRGVAEAERPDVLHLFTGVAEEAFSSRGLGALRTLVRGSAHIAAQRDLLESESDRAGVPSEAPSAWRIEREERGYVLADRIFVLSRFAERSFVACGVSPGKIVRIPLGVDVEGFRAPARVHEERLSRVGKGQRLRVLFVGAVSYQKGLLDLLEVANRSQGRYELRAVGIVTAEAEKAALSAIGVDFIGKVPQHQLAGHYAWADVFLLPTIQDGFGVVLCQAAAAGLPLIATENSGAPDLIEAGAPGWTLPIRSPGAILELLDRLDTDRPALLAAIEATRSISVSRSWEEVARQYRDAFLEGRQ